MKITLEVSSLQAESKFSLYDVRSVKNIDLPTQFLNFAEILKANSHLEGLPVKSFTNAKPMILIGLNNCRVTVPMKIREGDREQIIAKKYA